MRGLRANPLKVFCMGLAVLAAALVFGACSQASPDSSTIRFWSPAVRPNGVVSPLVSCGAGTIWLPLKWGAVPSDTEELVLLITRYKKETVAGSTRFKVPFAALVGKIKPTTHGIEANTYPPGVALAGSYGPISCPPARKGQKIMYELFALDHTLQLEMPLKASFVTRFTEESLGARKFATKSVAAAQLAEEPLAVGRFTATYGLSHPSNATR